MNRRHVLAAAAAFLSTTPGLAQAPSPHGSHGTGAHQTQHAAPAPSGNAVFRAGSLVIEAPWTRATPGGAKVAGGFMVIRNTGTEPDRLTGGTFPHAPRVEIHEMAVTDGMMRMRPVPGGIEIPAGGTIQLRPGGYHMMFMDLSQPVRTGAAVKGTLIFQKAGSVEVGYNVAPVGAPGPSAGHGRQGH